MGTFFLLFTAKFLIFLIFYIKISYCSLKMLQKGRLSNFLKREMTVSDHIHCDSRYTCSLSEWQWHHITWLSYRALPGKTAYHHDLNNQDKSGAIQKLVGGDNKVYQVQYKVELFNYLNHALKVYCLFIICDIGVWWWSFISITNQLFPENFSWKTQAEVPFQM